MKFKFYRGMKMKPEIFNEIKKIKRAIKKEKLVFLAGAGISIEPPSNLSAWPHLSSLKTLTDLDSNDEKLINNLVRPEIYFQLLYNVIGEKGIFPLKTINPEMINTKKRLVFPNVIHKFLAKMLKKGHIVLTTNFDNLIEIAYQETYNGKNPAVIIYDEDYQTLLKKKQSLKSAVLIKIHGSFVDPLGNDTYDSITAILQQVQKEIPHFKKQLLEKLIAQYNFVVLGYSGRDDFDLYSFFLHPLESRKIWWVSHFQADMDKWELLDKKDLMTESNEIALNPVPERTSEEWEQLNSNSIILAYSYGRKLNAHTAQFIQVLGNQNVDILENMDFGPEIEKKTYDLLQKWSYAINSAEKNYIMGNIFELLEEFERARTFFRKAANKHIILLLARKVLNKGRIHYKKRGKKNYESSETELLKAIKIFEDLQSISDQADVCLQLLLLSNRYKIADEGSKYGEKALLLYLKIDDIEPSSKIVEISWTLRGLALVNIKDIPDLKSVSNGKNKEHYKKIIEQSKELCNLSLKLLQKVGNRTGERGEGQTWNVRGIIFLREGLYFEANDSFKNFFGLVEGTRYSRESFQVYRNLALSEFNLARLKSDNKREYLTSSIENNVNALRCRNCDPTSPKFRSKDMAIYITQFNRSQSLIERGEKDNTKFAVKELTSLHESTNSWHWKGNTKTKLIISYLILGDEENILRLTEELIELYSGVNDSEFERQRFGIQNATENLQSLLSNKRIKNIMKEELYNQLSTLLQRISNLSQTLPSVSFKDYSKIIAEIKKRFLV